MVGAADMEATFNMGVGMVAVLPPEHVDDAVSTLGEFEVGCWVCGVLHEDQAGGRVALTGRHRA